MSVHDLGNGSRQLQDLLTNHADNCYITRSGTNEIATWLRTIALVKVIDSDPWRSRGNVTMIAQTVVACAGCLRPHNCAHAATLHITCPIHRPVIPPEGKDYRQACAADPA